MTLRLFKASDANWVTSAHGYFYQQDEGFNDRFKPVVAAAIQGFVQGHDPQTEAGWIAQQGGRRVGSIFCTRSDTNTAQIRLFFLLPDLRGTGMGQRMLRHAMRFADSCGYSDLKINTYAEHAAACALYDRMGFTLLESSPTRAYGRDLTLQSWCHTLCYSSGHG